MKLFLIIVISVFSIVAKAQQFKIDTGEEFEVPKHVWSNTVLDADNTGFYFLRNKSGMNRTMLLHKIDKSTAKTIYIKELDFEYNNAFNKNGKLLFFSFGGKNTNYLSNKSSLEIKLREVNSSNGELIGEPLFIDEIFSKNEKQVLSFDVSFSPDDKYILMTSSLKENEKLQQVICRLYETKNYKKVWEKEPITVYKNSTISSSQYKVDNSGTLIYSFAFIRSEFKNSDGKQDISFGIALESPNRILKINEIPSENKTLDLMKIELLNNTLVCTGTFNEGEKDIAYNAKRGFFLITIEPESMVIKTESFNCIDEVVKSKLIKSDKNGAKIDWDKRTIFYLNNSYYVVWEYSEYMAGYNGYAKINYPDAITTIKYTKEKTMDWMKVLPMSLLINTIGLNFLITDKLHFIYYENSENLINFPDIDNAIPKEYKAADLNKSNVICATIDETGKIKRKIIPIKEKIKLEENDPLKMFNTESKTLIIPVNVTERSMRYDVLKIEN